MSEQKNLKQMRDQVLRNGGYKDDSSDTIGDLQDDIDIWINNRYKELRKRNFFVELRMEETVVVPANTNSFSKPSSLKTIISIRKGTSTILLPIDPSQINNISASLWTRTDAPERFVQMGEEGIRLLGEYDEATTLSLFGKACSPDLTNDGDTPDIDVDDILIAGATRDLFVIARPIKIKEDYWNGEYEKLLAIALQEARTQQADEQCIKPQYAWTADIANARPGLMDTTTSKVPL